MAVEITQLDQISPAYVEQAEAFAMSLLAERQPNIDFKRGVIHDLVLGLNAILLGAAREEAARLQQSSSLLAITADPTLADDTLVARVLSNYRIVRGAATFATGELTIELSRLAAVTVPGGALFEGNGAQFSADASFSARTDSSQVLSGADRLITQIGPSRWAFTVTVTATLAGGGTVVKKDDQLVMLAPVANYVSSYAAADFTEAGDAQTNQELLDKLEEGLAIRAYSGRSAVRAMIRYGNEDHPLRDPDFEKIIAMSIIGAGDAEMIRDQHWIFPISGGGRTDIYIRSNKLYQALSVTKQAVLVSKTVDNRGVWQVSLDRDDAPGFYEATRITLEDADSAAPSYEVSSDTRSFDDTPDDTGDSYVPDIQSALEACYSRYQTAMIQFTDTDTDTTSLTVGTSQQNYDLTLLADPLVAQLQDYLNDRQIRNPAGDHLVKAAVPCFTGVSIVLERTSADITVDTDELAAAVEDYINSLGFMGKLYASSIHRLVDERLPDGVKTALVDLSGRIRRCDGGVDFLRSQSLLTVPDKPESFTTASTVVFYVASSDIAIEVDDVSAPNT